VVTDVLVDATPVPPSLQRRYSEEGAEPVQVDREAIAGLGVRLHEAALQSTPTGRQVRHSG
jgi:hypothetical protein